MVFKRLVLPESGIIYEITKGVLTGHSFTSIVTTLCAYMTIATSLLKTVPKRLLRKTFLQGAGDDWIMKLPANYLAQIEYFITNRSGNPCKSFYNSRGDPTDYAPKIFPTFLKKHYIGGFIAWNESELYQNFIYPTSTKFKLHNRVWDYITMCVSGPFNDRIIDICKRLIIFRIVDKVTMGRFNGGKSGKYYQWIFDTALHGLKHFRNVYKLLDILPKTIYHPGLEYSLGCPKYAFHFIVNKYLKLMDARVVKSRLWMVRPTLFERLESTRRLKVFDLNKVHIPPNHTYRANFKYCNI
jgi:hypothetical protein